MVSVRSKLITEEWVVVYGWMGEDPERHGDIDDFPDVHDFLDKWVPSFTDSMGLFIDGEFVAVGMLTDECHVHVAADPKYPNKVALLKAIRDGLVPYAKKKYKCLYTEFFADDLKSERFVRFLGFAVLPIPLNKKYKQAAMITRNDSNVKHILASQANNSKRSSSGKYRSSEELFKQAH